MGHDVHTQDDAGASRSGDDVRERLRARLAMANSQVLPLDEGEPTGAPKRPLTARTPKPVTAAAQSGGPTLIRSPRPTADNTVATIDGSAGSAGSAGSIGSIDSVDSVDSVDTSDIAHLFAEPTIVWQESAAEARRKLWGSAPDASEQAVPAASTALPDPGEPAGWGSPAAVEPVAAHALVPTPTLGEPVFPGARPVTAATAVTAEPVADPALVVAPIALAEPPVLMPPPVVPPPVVVEAEPILIPVYVPEVRDPTPVEPAPAIPEALVAAVAAVEPVAPAPAAPAAPAALVLPASVVPARTQSRAQGAAVADLTDFTQPVTKKTKKNKTVKAKTYHQKRHPIRKFFGFLIVLAVLAGGGYYGWHKYLRKAATWSAELKPAAAFVEKTLHREFDKTVPVVTLDPAGYEAKLVTHVLGQLYANPTVGSDLGTGAAAAAGLAAGPVPQSLALRAVGLVGTELPASVGGILAAHVTSFYSGGDHTIYRMDGTTATFQIDMLRSLSAALIDQAVDTTGSYAVASDASRAGLRGAVDGVANIVVVAKYKELASLQPSRDHELATRLAALPDPATPVYLYPFLSSYEIGGLGYEAAVPADPLAGVVTPADDAALFDPSRAPTAAAEGAASSPSSRELGMEFWFDALTPTLGIEAARQTALLWTGDTSKPSEVSGQACLDSTISTADANTQAALLAAMNQWVATRPLTSRATAAAAGTNGVTITSCSAIDVVEPVPTAEAGPMGTLFVRADEERYVLGRAVQLGLPTTPAARSCAVTAYRNGSINNVDPTAVDAETVAQITDVVTFCGAVS